MQNKDCVECVDRCENVGQGMLNSLYMQDKGCVECIDKCKNAGQSMLNSLCMQDESCLECIDRCENTGQSMLNMLTDDKCRTKTRIVLNMSAHLCRHISEYLTQSITPRVKINAMR